MKISHAFNTCLGALALIASVPAFSQVNQVSLQRIATSQVFTSTVPVKILFETNGLVCAAGQGMDGSLVVGKYSADGVELWRRSYQGAVLPNERPVSLALDHSGNLFVTAISRDVNDDYVTLKFDADGRSVWTNRLHGAGNGDDTPTASTTDPAGNVYVTGSTYVSTMAIPLKGTVVTRAITTACYTPSGLLKWRTDYQPTFGGRKADAIAVDGCGRVLVSGMSTFFPDPRAPADQLVVLSFDAGNGTSRVIYSGDQANGFGLGGQTQLAVVPGCELVFAGRRPPGIGPASIRVVRFSNDQVLVWSNLISFAGLYPPAGLSGLQVDTNGSIYVGSFSHDPSLGFPTNGANYRVTKFTKAGAWAWESVYDGPAFRDDVSTALLTDATGHSYVCGTSGLAEGLVEWATVEVQPDGTQAWVAHYGGATNANFLPMIMRQEAHGALYVAGTVPGLATAGTDLLVIKYTQHQAVITRSGKHRVQLYFVGPPGATQRLQRAVDLPHWSDLETLVADQDGAVSYETDIEPGSRRAFFRAVSP